ncbi:MAG: hypothetical protein HY403_11965 [Elusimicrobia bacterium]|nr:hypothetical protein [Elusimicrobiota bacterium]
MKNALLPILAALLTAACREEAITRARVPKEEAPAARAAGHDHDHDHGMEAPAAVEAPAERPRGLAWTAPAGWKEVAGNGIRLATFTPPGGLKTEATVVALPGDSGGELANVNRWRGQIGLPPTDEAGMAAARARIATKAGPATIYDFTGTGETRARMIVAAVGVGGTTWFFKLMGEAAATESARAGFMTMIKGLAPDAPK